MLNETKIIPMIEFLSIMFSPIDSKEKAKPASPIPNKINPKQ